MIRAALIVVAAVLLTGCSHDTPAPAPTKVPTSRLDWPAPHQWGRPSRHYTTTAP